MLTGMGIQPSFQGKIAADRRASREGLSLPARLDGISPCSWHLCQLSSPLAGTQPPTRRQAGWLSALALHHDLIKQGGRGTQPRQQQWERKALLAQRQGRSSAGKRHGREDAGLGSGTAEKTETGQLEGPPL